MNISREQAIKIAQEFLRNRLPERKVHLDAPSARLIKGQSGNNEWSVMFDEVIPPDVVVCPAEIIVLVDETSGAASLQLML